MSKIREFLKEHNFENHIENGLFIENHYTHSGDGRAASGSMYYYVAPGEKTEFHRIDCDEYWSYNAGDNIELWVVGLDGKLSVKMLGLGDGAEPTIRFAAGEIFASRIKPDAKEGCLITCITVPRFTYDGFELFEKKRITQEYPETKAFWE